MKSLSNNIAGKLKNIKIILFDLNGVLLKGKDLNEVCSPDFDICFGELVNFFKNKNILLGITTASREEKNLKKEFEKYGIDIRTSSLNKVKLATEILKKHNLNFENLLYVGDEIFDVPLMQKAGFSIAPQNASRTVKRLATYVATNSAGAELLKEIKELFENLHNEQKN
jgi:YrbI family 3-deoxy-D-manno-octulosonate 8-phosphate phosphatase